MQDLTHQPFLVLKDCFEHSSSWKEWKLENLSEMLTSQTTFGALAKRKEVMVCPTPSYLRAVKPLGVELI